MKIPASVRKFLRKLWDKLRRYWDKWRPIIRREVRILERCINSFFGMKYIEN